jgi:magnesium chelatase family protein
MNAIGAVTLRGMEALPVEVEVEITGGLFSISIVGLPDIAVKESKERVRAALRAVGLPLKGRVAVNLAPADLPILPGRSCRTAPCKSKLYSNLDS